MVLILYIFAYLLGPLTIHSELFAIQSELFEKYERQIEKAVQSTFQTKDISYREIAYPHGDYREIYAKDLHLGYICISEVEACNLGGCQAKEKKAASGVEFFDVLIITDNNYSIRRLDVLDYFSDYGYEITSKKYLKRFINKNACDFHLNIDDIDAISGATISSNALENTLKQICIFILEQNN